LSVRWAGDTIILAAPDLTVLTQLSGDLVGLPLAANFVDSDQAAVDP